MKFTSSQKQFIDIATEKIRRFHLDLINVKDWGSGVTTALRHISKNLTDENARHIWLTGRSSWDVVIALMRLAGRDTYGYGTLDTLHRTLRKLSEPEHARAPRRSLCLWIDDARLIRPIDRETLVAFCEHVSQHEGIPVRLVLIVGKVRTWDNEAQKKINTIAHPERLMTRVDQGRARMFDFTREGMNEIEDTNDAETYAVKTA